MAGSIERVTKEAADAGLDIEIRRMGASTRRPRKPPRNAAARLPRSSNH
ncbi:hypothetical protein [Mesorhizobium sp.]